MQVQKIEVIANETGGNHRTEKLLPGILAQLQATFGDYSLHKTEYHGHAEKLAAALCQENSDQPQTAWVLLVIGGDGTLHEVINGLQKNGGRKVAVGYIPTGTGDDFARAAGISEQPKKAIAQIAAASQPTALDIGVITMRHGEKHYFVNNIGIGLDALIVHLTNHSSSKMVLNKFHLGNLSYPLNAISAYQIQEPYPIRIKNAQGAHYQFERTFLMTVTNHPYFGGGIPIAPPADLQDHSLYLVLVEKPKLRGLPSLVYKILSSHSMDTPAIFHLKDTAFSLNVASKQHIQIDGEEGYSPIITRLSLSSQPFLI
ncbi:hypothetical protein IV38_GL001079 [Lactobacillus selangorensis]|uniref:DAGKc domain-containing protein n=1 Tax=Lactobacillus selangorensis TaxID=81857 RepID=A0A0R2FTT3_9LACO|nr:YegS/Rv2252/BmrU family lipid kinase [Lactobacillus selangorensis]KRN28871.1 hypothetical protein IV38_GL001079 [Lactobacillus selangorensis]KRN32719.1 hypothetical protein IV40_GL000774 [Lactobacillus selangorensis]